MSELWKIMNERNTRDHVTYLLARTRVVKKLAYSSYVTSAHEVGQWTHVRARGPSVREGQR